MIAIIGAGPVGSYIGKLLAEKGEEVQIFEEHSIIGKPVQCTGIVTGEIKKIIQLKKDFLVNELNGVRVFSKNNFAEIKLKEIVLDREEFDTHLAEKAIDSGAKIFLSHKFINFNQEKNSVEIKDLKNKRIKKIKTDILIGADGPLSAVAQSTGLFGNREFYLGMQARVKIKKDDFFEVFFGGLCPGFFAWIVPEDTEIARVGLATKTNTKFYFNNFLNKLKINGSNIIEKQAGLIPVFNPKIKINYKNIYLTGDSAAQVKATTGGGLVPGLISAKILADSIINKKIYEKEFKQSIGKELSLNLKLRKFLNKFNEKDYDYLIKLINKNNLKKILNQYNRDYPSRFLIKLLLNEPKLLYFLKKVF